MPHARYKIRLSFEEGDGCLWAGDDPTAEQFGGGPWERMGGPPALSPALRERLYRLRVHYETQFDLGVKGYGPWTPEQEHRFSSRVQAVLADLVANSAQSSRSTTSIRGGVLLGNVRGIGSSGGSRAGVVSEGRRAEAEPAVARGPSLTRPKGLPRGSPEGILAAASRERKRTYNPTRGGAR